MLFDGMMRDAKVATDLLGRFPLERPIQTLLLTLGKFAHIRFPKSGPKQVHSAYSP